MIKYSIVIPAYNEAGNITSSLTQVVSFMKTFTPSYEIVVVDDGSADNTVKLVEDYSKTNPEIRLIKNEHKGKGPTVWKGFMEAQGELIYLADADMAADISEIKKLSFWIKDQGYDIAIASREGAGALREEEPIYRHIMGRVFNFWVQSIALPGIKDSQCGFKLFKKEVAKDIFSKLSIYGDQAEVIEKPYVGAFDVEVLYLARKLGYKVKEVPITWRYIKTNRINPISDSLNMAKDVLKVKFNDRKGVYGKS